MAAKSALRLKSSGSVAANRRSAVRGGVESTGVWLADAPVATHTPTRAVSAAPHLRLTRSKLTEQVYRRRGRLASRYPGLAPGVSPTVSSCVSGPGAAVMRWITGVGGAVLLAVVLWDAFETIILPRRVGARRFLGRAAAMGRRLGHDGGGRRRHGVLVGPVHERHDVLHARPRRRRAPERLRQDAHRGGGGNRIRLPRSRDRIISGDLSGVLAPRGRDLAARRARRLTAQRGRALVAAPRGSARRGAGRAAQGMGALGRRRAREPSVVSTARLFPVAALQRVVGGGPNDHP